MKIALVHDYLNQMGGAERVLLALHDLYPDAPIYTSLYDPARVDPAFQHMDVRPSFMQRLPFARHHHQPFLLLYPFAFERWDLRSYDLVLSSSSAFAKGVITRPDALHICYCHTPMRWAWNYQEYVQRERLGPLVRWLLPFAMTPLRLWDQMSAMRVDYFIANSPTVAQRVAKYYRRSAAIIPPPVATSSYAIAPVQDDYFLIVSRLIPYKRLDLAIEAFNHLRLPLKIIGEGRDRRRLERLAGPTIEFLGRLPDAQVRLMLARCQALIHPGEEDFGLAPLEAQASGRPVIAYAGGGALTSIIEGVTGVFFRERSAWSLAEAVCSFKAANFDPQTIRRHAEEFDLVRFQRRIGQFIAAKLAASETPDPEEEQVQQH
ncbi:MAG TPA: glycosyltransferase [Ktedonobacterales bacterium]|jgi:glycosyltransferase involved in cell wall biosynthesis